MTADCDYRPPAGWRGYQTTVEAEHATDLHLIFYRALAIAQRLGDTGHGYRRVWQSSGDWATRRMVARAEAAMLEICLGRKAIEEARELANER